MLVLYQSSQEYNSKYEGKIPRPLPLMTALNTNIILFPKHFQRFTMTVWKEKACYVWTTISFVRNWVGRGKPAGKKIQLLLKMQTKSSLKKGLLKVHVQNQSAKMAKVK